MASKVNCYDPKRRAIFLRPDASSYARYHELAHKEQHESKAVVFFAWIVLRRIRLVGYLVTMWIEMDAYCRARAVMRGLGIWTDEAESEAKEKLRNYATRSVRL